MQNNLSLFQIFRVNCMIASIALISSYRPIKTPDRAHNSPTHFTAPSPPPSNASLELYLPPSRNPFKNHYAFFLLPLPPSPPPTALPLALTASSTVSLSAASAATPAALPGSAFAITGVAPASICWKGRATKWPALSNQSAKGRERVVVVAVGAVADWEVMVRV